MRGGAKHESNQLVITHHAKEEEENKEQGKEGERGRESNKTIG